MANQCKSCGVELKENAKFCSKCGTKVETDVCAKCNAPLKAGANFCPKCGTKVNVQANDVSPGKGEEQKTMPSTQVKQKKVEVSPEDIARAEELAEKGSKLIDKEKYDEAIKVLNESISLNPDNYSAFFWRGLAYESVEEYDKAINDYTETIRLEPSEKVTYSSRGRAYLSNEEYEMAISDFTEYIASDHTDAYAYNLRGNAYYNSGDFSSAIKDYNRAIKLKPKEKTFKENLQNAEEALKNDNNEEEETEEDDEVDAEEEENDEDGLFKCENCDAVITIESDSIEHNSTYVCPNCNEEVEVSFWGTCEKCNKKVGFRHYSTGKQLLNLGLSFLEGYMADENKAKEMKKNFFGRVFSKVVDAAEYGECPFCKREYLMCPECEKSVRWPLNTDDDAVITCSCGTKMKHP